MIVIFSFNYFYFFKVFKGKVMKIEQCFYKMYVITPPPFSEGGGVVALSRECLLNFAGYDYSKDLRYSRF